MKIIIRIIMEDDRPIKCLCFEDCVNHACLRVGDEFLDGNQVSLQSERSMKITKIVPYHENGAGGSVVFYAVYVDWGDQIWKRIPATMCYVEYI